MIISLTVTDILAKIKWPRNLFFLIKVQLIIFCVDIKTTKRCISRQQADNRRHFYKKWIVT